MLIVYHAEPDEAEPLFRSNLFDSEENELIAWTSNRYEEDARA